MVVCAGCERPILDRFLFNVLDRAWHSKCVQCSDCKANLTEKCFSRDGQLYCRDDFFRRFGTKCGGCSQGISPNDLVRRARNKVFHLKCFTCMICRKQLSTGEELYVLDENKFICKEDYINSKYSQGSDHEDEMDMDSSMLDKLDEAMSDKGSVMGDDCDSHDSSLPSATLPTLALNSAAASTPSQSTNSSLLGPNDQSDLSLPGLKLTSPGPGEQVTVKVEKNNNDTSSSNNNPDNKENSSVKNSEGEDKDGSDLEGEATDGKKPTGTKRRGPRTTIKAKQLETLKAAFAATPKPTRHIREQLAQETGLNMRVIQVWFQNRRSKERRMKQLSALGARRAFFRNPRRMRGLGPDDAPELMGGPGFNYFGDNGEFYPAGPYPGGYPGDFYPGQPDPQNMGFLPPTSGPQGTPPLDVQGVPGQLHDGQQYAMHPDMLGGGPPRPPSPGEAGLPPLQQAMEQYGPPGGLQGPPRSVATGFGHMQPPNEMQETW